MSIIITLYNRSSLGVGHSRLPYLSLWHTRKVVCPALHVCCLIIFLGCYSRYSFTQAKCDGGGDAKFTLFFNLALANQTQMSNY